uniref:PHD domain-containing protein n=1 Tax=Panagrellus redivivus TaxID=6233 RepID=A0A7E4UQU7_PANRE
MPCLGREGCSSRWRRKQVNLMIVIEGICEVIPKQQHRPNDQSQSNEQKNHDRKKEGRWKHVICTPERSEYAKHVSLLRAPPQITCMNYRLAALPRCVTSVAPSKQIVNTEKYKKFESSKKRLTTNSFSI